MVEKGPSGHVRQTRGNDIAEGVIKKKPSEIIGAFEPHALLIQVLVTIHDLDLLDVVMDFWILGLWVEPEVSITRTGHREHLRSLKVSSAWVAQVNPMGELDANDPVLIV
jgi:hypothetical protein